MSSSLNWSILIQSNWSELVSKEGSVFWVTYKEFGQSGDHDKIKKEGNEMVANEGKFNVKMINKVTMKVTHIKSNASSLFLGPEDYFTNIHSGARISSIDVSNGGLGVLCGGSEILRVWDSSTGTVRRVLEGHLGEVYTVKLFPSGIVLLSGGADMQLKIWSAETGKCPVTLTGHTQAIMDTAIVDKGKNIISVSKDGTARLWNCANSECIAVLATLDEQINCCDLMGGSLFGGTTNATGDAPGEVETTGKVLALGGEGGTLAAVDVASRKVIYSAHLKSAVNSVALTKDYLYAGCQDGQVHIVSKSQDQLVTSVLTCSCSPVLCVRVVCGGVCVSRQDGSVTIHYLHQSPPGRVELTGADTEPVYQVVGDSAWVYTGCRDGVVGKYKVDCVKKLVV